MGEYVDFLVSLIMHKYVLIGIAIFVIWLVYRLLKDRAYEREEDRKEMLSRFKPVLMARETSFNGNEVQVRLENTGETADIKSVEMLKGDFRVRLQRNSVPKDESTFLILEHEPLTGKPPVIVGHEIRVEMIVADQQGNTYRQLIFNNGYDYFSASVPVLAE